MALRLVVGLLPIADGHDFAEGFGAGGDLADSVCLIGLCLPS